jgi:hypothetical protein
VKFLGKNPRKTKPFEENLFVEEFGRDLSAKSSVKFLGGKIQEKQNHLNKSVHAQVLLPGVNEPQVVVPV